MSEGAYGNKGGLPLLQMLSEDAQRDEITDSKPGYKGQSVGNLKTARLFRLCYRNIGSAISLPLCRC